MTIDALLADTHSSLMRYSAPEISNYGGAVQGLQNAGLMAVTNLGPLIDSESGGDDRVKKITHWAWLKNSTLAGVPNGDKALRRDVDQAASMLKEMIAWFDQAHRLAKSLHYMPHTQAPPIVGPLPKMAPPDPTDTDDANDFRKPSWWKRFLAWMEILPDSPKT